MYNEKTMNNYYNLGGFNRPQRIGYMMKMIRDLCPLTMEEWKSWYFENVHNAEYLHQLAVEMQATIPVTNNISVNDCERYIYDVMFRRTFQGYNKEKQALKLLRDMISPSIEESPKEWDSRYFIDFYLRDASGMLIGIQLKPDTFYLGNYQAVVDIEGKMKSFREKYNAETFVLKYNPGKSNQAIEFVNPNVVSEIKKLLSSSQPAQIAC